VFWPAASLTGQRSLRGGKQSVVLIHCDVPSLFFGAIIARIQGLQIASIGAGLRSFNLLRLFPEELVGVATGKLGLIDIHFFRYEAALFTTGRDV